MIRSTIVIFISLLFNNDLHAIEKNLKTCKELDILAYNSIKRAKFSKDGKREIGERVINKSLVYVWSNSTDRIQKVYFINKSKNIEFNNVEVRYVRDEDKKTIRKKVYEIKKVKNKYYELSGFLFLDEVTDPSDRPGLQYYILKKDDLDICYEKIIHIYATEET